MMEGPNRELELVGVIHHSLQVGDRVTMCVDMNLTTKRSSESLPGNLARKILIQGLNTLRLSLRTPVILLLDQISRLLKSVAKLVAFTHTAEWPISNSAMNTLRVLTTCHLHVSPVAVWVSKQVHCTDFLAAIRLANCVLDDIGLSANIVAGTRKDE
jgi:hypothetical protein